MKHTKIDAATSAFRATLERLEGAARRVSDEIAEPAGRGHGSKRRRLLELDEELGERAALMAVAGQLWRQHLGPLLTTADLQKMGNRSRQAVHDMVRRKRLLALPTESGHYLFPAFQLTPTGQPHPSIPKILAAFEGAAESPYTVASWLRTPQALLGERTPAELLTTEKDPSLVVEAARRSAAKLRR